MSGFLHAYEGQAERQHRRMQMVKRVVLWGLLAAIAGAIAFYSLRTRSQEQVVKQFLDDLQRQQYQEAYRLWGCTQDAPCKYYPPEEFTQDWGPSSRYAHAAALCPALGCGSAALSLCERYCSICHHSIASRAKVRTQTPVGPLAIYGLA